MHRMIFGDAVLKNQDDKHAATAPARIPQPGCLRAEMTPLDVPAEVKDKINFGEPGVTITDDYFVSWQGHNSSVDAYVKLYPRKGDHIGKEIKLSQPINSASPNFKFITGIKIQDAKNEIDCVATASGKGIRVWKCDDLKPGVLKNPFKDYSFADVVVRASDRSG